MSKRKLLIAVMITAIQLTPQKSSAQNCNTLGGGSVCGSKEIAAATQLTNDVYVYKGIQYATVGSAWNPATKVTSYDSNTPAYRFGAICPQMRDGAAVGEAECLFLNIWTPTTPNEQGKLPVMVFIHGGAFVFGSGNDSALDGTPMYDGAHFAGQQGVVLVTLNYRLGAYGFMPMKSDGTAAQHGGNFGLQDQAVALQWVQDNIHHFGGDKGQVTIFGESAGAMSVGFHLTTVATSANLFQAAIMESNPLGYHYRDTTQAKRDANDYFDCLHAVIQNKKRCGASAEKPSSKPTAMQVLEAQGRFLKLDQGRLTTGSGLPEALLFSPIVDGTYVKGQPNAAIGTATKPVLAGFNQDEGVLFGALAAAAAKKKTGLSFKLSEYEGQLKKMFQNPSTIWKEGNRYSKDVEITSGLPNKASQALANVITDFAFHCPNLEINSSTPSDSPVWLYVFDADPELTVFPVGACAPGTGKACHGSELTYVFDSASTTDPKARQLAQTMNTAWANFAKNPATGPGSGWAKWSWSDGKPSKPGTLNRLTVSGLANVPASGSTELYSTANCDFWRTVKIKNKDPKVSTN